MIGSHTVPVSDPFIPEDTDDLRHPATDTSNRIRGFRVRNKKNFMGVFINAYIHTFVVIEMHHPAVIVQA
jgi:hypothetical protein